MTHNLTTTEIVIFGLILLGMGVLIGYLAAISMIESRTYKSKNDIPPAHRKETSEPTNY